MAGGAQDGDLAQPVPSAHTACTPPRSTHLVAGGVQEGDLARLPSVVDVAGVGANGLRWVGWSWGGCGATVGRAAHGSWARPAGALGPPQRRPAARGPPASPHGSGRRTPIRRIPHLRDAASLPRRHLGLADEVQQRGLRAGAAAEQGANRVCARERQARGAPGAPAEGVRRVRLAARAVPAPVSPGAPPRRSRAPEPAPGAPGGGGGRAVRGRRVLPWSTWPMTVTTGGRGTRCSRSSSSMTSAGR